MMEKPMTVERASAIASSISAGRKKFGAQFRAPFRAYEIEEAAAVLLEHGNFDAPSKEELTKCRRQMAALNARYEALKRKGEKQ